MLRWTLSDVARITGGLLTGSAEVRRVVTDSRDAGEGDLFVAILGEHHDGHDFAADVLAAGGSVLVQHRRLPAGGHGVEVRDTLEALRLLAKARRNEVHVPTVAITGSSGKTSTKDLARVALGRGTHASERSLNNEIGVPLTMLGVPNDATALVIEVGARNRGDIALLAPVVCPDVAVITAIGRAHLETFGDESGVLEAKWELVEALGPDGIAVLPVEDERLVSRRTGPMITFGERADADVAALDVSVDSTGHPAFRLVHDGRSFDVRLPVAGIHQARNAAAAVAAAIAVGRDLDDAVDALAETAGSPWRMEVHRGRYTVVNDAYNANPDSTTAALETVAAMPGRHIAVLGEMLELGDSAAAGHHEVGAAARRLGFANVIVVGSDPGILAGAGPVGRAVADADEALEVIRRVLRDDDVVLVKASRGVGLETLAATLAEEAAS
jgi:UDP-N-acetylmuramoyl-tripeptide--D-alanyl-D-alanine ligase